MFQSLLLNPNQLGDLPTMIELPHASKFEDVLAYFTKCKLMHSESFVQKPFMEDRYDRKKQLHNFGLL